MADAAEEIEKNVADAGGFKRTAKDLFGGAVGGAVQVLVGMIPSTSSFRKILSRFQWLGISISTVEWRAY